MATEYTLRRADGQPFGTFDQARTMVRRLFPEVTFYWTTSGPEKLRLAAERGVELAPLIRQAIESLPSLLEGVAEGEDYHVTFGFGHQEPVSCLYVTSRGDSAELFRRLSAMEAEAGAEFKVSGDE